MHKRDSVNMFGRTGFMKKWRWKRYSGFSQNLLKPRFVNVDLTLKSTVLQGNDCCRYINYLNG